MSFKSLPGFRDFYPADCELRESIFRVWREVSRGFGFSQYDGPPLEPLELYRKKSGDEILGQLYHFEDRGGREVAMRPEMTPTLARMAGLRQRDFKKPMKWFAIPQLFRYERQQRGRLREHFQWNCDILGEPGLGAEAELLALLSQALTRLGLGAEDVVIRMSDRIFWRDFLEKHGVPEDEHYRFYQALDKIEREKPEVTKEKLGALYDAVQEVFSGGASNERLEEVSGYLNAMGLGDWIEIDLKIVRGLAYYTGIVFEVHDRKGEFRAIAGGGRYDDLVKLLTGQDLTALGFGMGDVVVAEILKDRGLDGQEGSKLDVYVVIADEEYRPAALRVVHALRSQGHRVAYSMSPMKVGKQFQAAEDAGAVEAMVIDAHVKEGNCYLKRLATREQVEISFTERNGALVFSSPIHKE